MEEPLRLVAFEFRGWLKGGNTRPLLVATTDENGNQRVVVLKLRRPLPPVGDGHYGATSLACELTCAVVARAADIQVPDYAIVDVPAELSAAVPDTAAATLLSQNVGPNFGSTFVEGMGLWHERDTASSPELLGFFEQLIQFDAALVNGDRKAIKANVLWRGTIAYAIDHSLALPVHQWPVGAENDIAMLPEAHVRQHAAFRIAGESKPRLRICP
ncbi:MAG: hypothetical protein QM736_20545 [Vicinamibacterales bacterium]